MCISSEEKDLTWSIAEIIYYQNIWEEVVGREETALANSCWTIATIKGILSDKALPLWK